MELTSGRGMIMIGIGFWENKVQPLWPITCERWNRAGAIVLL